MKKLIARIIKHQDAVLNAIFVGGLLLIIWAGVRVLTAPGVPCFGF